MKKRTTRPLVPGEPGISRRWPQALAPETVPTKKDITQ